MIYNIATHELSCFHMIIFIKLVIVALARKTQQIYTQGLLHWPNIKLYKFLIN